ncbi:MAG TPA: hypothetical protein VNL96_10410 [Gemmatimonadaceae bacterium]|nr:hypothetical protein [Gemmatimonadaceae bacterium]
MKVRTLALAAVAVLATALPAQQKPSFAGQWTLIADPNAPPGRGRGGGMFGGLGQAATITQDEKTITITRTTQAGEIKYVYNLDGSESKNTVTMGGNAVELVSHAKWEGDKLVITTTTQMGGNPVEIRMVLSLDAEGNLVVENTAPGRGGGGPVTTTTKYKKG